MKFSLSKLYMVTLVLTLLICVFAGPTIAADVGRSAVILQAVQDTASPVALAVDTASAVTQADLDTATVVQVANAPYMQLQPIEVAHISVPGVLVAQADTTTPTSETTEIPPPNDTGGFGGSILSILDKSQADIVYARSFDSGKSTAALKLAFPMYTGYVLGKEYVLNVDALGFIDDSPDLGLGGSATLKNVVGKLDLGVGWMPHGYGAVWYVGVKF